MIIACPSCSTRFNVPGASIPAEGRRVRCAKCANVWYVFPEEASPPAAFAGTEAQETDAGEAAAPPASRRARPAVKRGRRPPVGWLVFAVVACATLGGAFAGRDELVRVWPPLLGLYSAVGLAPEPPGAGLELVPPKLLTKTMDGATVVSIEGRIANPGDRERTVPDLYAQPAGPHGEMLPGWSIEPSHKALLPGEIATYVSEHTVGEAVASVTITFR